MSEPSRIVRSARPTKINIALIIPRIFIPTIKMMPEIWPVRRIRPWDVDSGAGKDTSAQYWNPTGAPAPSRKKPNTNDEIKRVV